MTYLSCSNLSVFHEFFGELSCPTGDLRHCLLQMAAGNETNATI